MNDTPLYQAVATVPQTNAISRYGLAFFEKHLKGLSSFDEILNQKDPAIVYYKKEENNGNSLEFGEAPPLNQNSRGGILRAILKTLLVG